MAQTWIISIDKTGAPPGQPQVKFTPNPLGVNAGDVIYWRNNDSVGHWPAPKTGSKTDWMDFQIPGKLADQPAPTSQQAEKRNAVFRQTMSKYSSAEISMRPMDVNCISSPSVILRVSRVSMSMISRERSFTVVSNADI